MNCGSCKSKFTSRSQSITCDGYCNEQFHLSCCNVPADVLKFTDNVPGLKWYCKKCCTIAEKCEPKLIKEIFEESTNSLVKGVENSFLQLKNEITQIAANKLEDVFNMIKNEIDRLSENKSNDTDRAPSVSGTNNPNLYSTVLKGTSAEIIKPRENKKIPKQRWIYYKK